MNVGLIEGIKIELNQIAAEMGGLADWAAGSLHYAPAMFLPSFCLFFNF